MRLSPPHSGQSPQDLTGNKINVSFSTDFKVNHLIQVRICYSGIGKHSFGNAEVDSVHFSTEPRGALHSDREIFGSHQHIPNMKVYTLLFYILFR